MKKPHPFKGVPRSEWPRVKAEIADRKAARAPSEQPGHESQFGSSSEVEAAKAAYDPNIVRETLQPPRGSAFGFPNNKMAAESAPAPQDVSLDSIPPNLFSGDQKHLEVMGLDYSTTDPIPGFKLYWFDAKNGVVVFVFHLWFSEIWEESPHSLCPAGCFDPGVGKEIVYRIARVADSR